MREGRLESAATGNNTEAALNFKPKLNREFLQTGYRELMKRLYEPKAYYQRIRTFLKNHRSRGPGVRLARSICGRSSNRSGCWASGTGAATATGCSRQHRAPPPAPVPPGHGAGDHGIPFSPNRGAALKGAEGGTRRSIQAEIETKNNNRGQARRAWRPCLPMAAARAFETTTVCWSESRCWHSRPDADCATRRSEPSSS